MENIINYYNKFNENERLVIKKSNLLEFETTKYLLNEYIKKGDKILETGAGSGVYSFYYANKGNEVTATDLVPKHIKNLKAEILEKDLSNITADLVNATNLKRYPDNSYDVVLCLGPMYHLVDEKDKENCIKESLRVLKPGGILAVAYVNKHYILPSLLLSETKFLEEDFIDLVLNKGAIKEEDNYGFWTDSCYYTPKEIDKHLSSFNLIKLENAATDGIGRLLQERINKLTDEEFEVYKKYHFESCREESIVGNSNHALWIGKKMSIR